MGFGLSAAGENDDRRRRDGLARRSQDRNGLGRRRRHRRHQHQATDAATIGAVFAVGVVRGGGGLPGDDGVADNAAGNGGSLGRRARNADAREQARQRNRISGSKRNDAPPQHPRSGILTHSP